MSEAPPARRRPAPARPVARPASAPWTSCSSPSCAGTRSAADAGRAGGGCRPTRTRLHQDPGRRGVRARGGHRRPDLRHRWLSGWSLARMPRVDRNALRIAVFELDYLDVPDAGGRLRGGAPGRRAVDRRVARLRKRRAGHGSGDESVLSSDAISCPHHGQPGPRRVPGVCRSDPTSSGMAKARGLWPRRSPSSVRPLPRQTGDHRNRTNAE